MPLSFGHTRTRRISVTLRELTMGESIGLCKIPSDRPELTTTEMLKCAASDARQPVPGYVTDPRLLTVEERLMLVVTYLAHVSSDGPDFSVGELKMSDYFELDADSDKDQTVLGMVADKERVMRPLLGLHVEALESICTKRGDWIRGAIACQMFEASDQAGAQFPVWAEATSAQVIEWIEGRMDKLLKLPESMFEEIYAAWLDGSEHLRHFVDYTFDATGIVCVVSQKGQGGSESAAARFRADTCISGTARFLAQ